MIYFLDPSYRQWLTVPELPFSEIERMGAGMYKGEKRAGVVQSVEHENQFEMALRGDPPAPQNTEYTTGGVPELVHDA